MQHELSKVGIEEKLRISLFTDALKRLNSEFQKASFEINRFAMFLPRKKRRVRRLKK